MKVTQDTLVPRGRVKTRRPVKTPDSGDVASRPGDVPYRSASKAAGEPGLAGLVAADIEVIVCERPGWRPGMLAGEAEFGVGRAGLRPGDGDGEN